MTSYIKKKIVKREYGHAPQLFDQIFEEIYN